MKENKDLKSVAKGDSGVKGDFADPLWQTGHGCSGYIRQGEGSHSQPTGGRPDQDSRFYSKRTP